MKVNLKQKRKNFTIISNKLAKDSKISLKAKGMCLVLVHFPDDWHFYEEKLQNYCTDKRTAITNALKELETAGYSHRKQLREKGRFSNKLWIFSDEGLLDEDIMGVSTDCRKSDVGKADRGKLPTTNTHSNNTQENKKKILKKRKKEKIL